MDRWLLYIEGGAWCFTAESCASRAKGQLGSSLTYLNNFPRDSGHGHNPVLLGGITSGKLLAAPPFCWSLSQSGPSLWSPYPASLPPPISHRMHP